MATAEMKRHDLLPPPRVAVKDSDGEIYDLSNHKIKFLMWFEDSLITAIPNATDTATVLSGANVDRIEVGDTLLCEHERMVVTTVPTQPITTDAIFVVDRGVNIAATSGYIMASTDVAGAGVNAYVLSDDATFNCAVDGGGATQVTVTAASTVGNLSMANLVTDVNTALGTASAAATASGLAEKLKIASDATGTTASIVITTPNAIATAELGVIAAYGVGTDGKAITALAHLVDTVVNVIKIEADAEIESIALGTIKYQWVDGDTDKTGEYYLAFEVTNSNGKVFTMPVTKTDLTVGILTDSNDYAF